MDKIRSLNDAMKIIKKVFNATDGDIKNIRLQKKGMTNDSFLFDYNNEKYIMRIPGPGTSNLINRKEEADVYNVIKQINEEVIQNQNF